MRSFVAAVRFLTRIPIPGPQTPVEALVPAVGWFPVVGGLVGLATAALYSAALRLWSPAVAAVMAIAFGLLLTGGFHEDGLTDAVDGLGGGFTKDRVLEIMKDSRIGAFGAMGLWCLLTLRWAALCQLGTRSLWVLPMAMVWGRWSIALTLRALPTISEGLAKEVHHRGGPLPLLHATLWLLVINGFCWYLGTAGLWRPAMASLATTVLWAIYLRRRLGGHSGDLLGAGNQLVEAAALLGMMLH